MEHFCVKRDSEKKSDICWFMQIFIFNFTDLTDSKVPFLSFFPMFVCVHLHSPEWSPKPVFLNFFFLLSSCYGKVVTF